MTATSMPRHLSPDVSVLIDLSGQTVTARVHGRVDCITVGVLRDRLLELARSGIATMVVDLSGADLLDATGPAALLHVRDVCRLHGTAFSVVVDPRSGAERTLRGCGLYNLLVAPRQLVSR